MCNAWNHSPGCDCGWGGDGHGGGYGGNGGGYGGAHSVTRSTFGGQIFQFPYTTYPSYINPNAKCPVCGASVYFYQSPYGGRVFFDELGPPWPKHPCTDSSDPFSSDPNREHFLPSGGYRIDRQEVEETDSLKPSKSEVAAPVAPLAPWVLAGWMPFVVTQIIPRRIGIEVEGHLFISPDEALLFRIVQDSPEAQYYRSTGNLSIGFTLVVNATLVLTALNESPILLKKDPDLEHLALSTFILTPSQEVEEISFNVAGLVLNKL